jgi:hypothetical protein
MLVLRIIRILVLSVGALAIVVGILWLPWYVETTPIATFEVSYGSRYVVWPILVFAGFVVVALLSDDLLKLWSFVSIILAVRAGWLWINWASRATGVTSEGYILDVSDGFGLALVGLILILVGSVLTIVDSFLWDRDAKSSAVPDSTPSESDPALTAETEARDPEHAAHPALEPEHESDPQAVEIEARLATLEALKQDGTITAAEYEQKRRDILGNL